jgi:glycosyltransferase involved in cell wall biosynthesis
LLGVCIPTYKRPDQLRRCLESIIRSAGEQPVPIHVADDSTDDTNDAVVGELAARYPHLVHHRNPRNLGIDGNIVHAVNLCEARHAWILGEDDRMLPEAIPTLLSLLSGGDRPFVFVNYASVDEDVAMVLRERSLPLERDSEEGANEFFAAHAWSMGFIGACVVDRDLWGTVDASRYVGTYYAHVGTILEYLRGRRVYLAARPMVLNRTGRPGAFTWTRSTFDVLHGWSAMVDRLRPLYPGEICDRAASSYRRAHGLGSVALFAYLRADRALTPEVHEAHVRTGPYSSLERAASWAIARTPAVVFQAARWTLTAWRGRRNRRLPDS